jgi:hypothetical protein
VWAHASTSGIHAPAYDEAVIVADDLEELVGGERRLVRLHQLVSTLALRKGKSLAGCELGPFEPFEGAPPGTHEDLPADRIDGVACQDAGLPRSTRVELARGEPERKKEEHEVSARKNGGQLPRRRGAVAYARPSVCWDEPLHELSGAHLVDGCQIVESGEE